MSRSALSSTEPEQFLDQFEGDGDGWLYRYKATGAAYRVTDAEKDAFVAAYNRYAKRLRWIPAMLYLGLLFAVFWAASFRWPPPGSAPFKTPLLLNAFFALFINVFSSIIDHFAFRLPMRVLQHRIPVAPAWPKSERRRRALDRVPDTLVIGAAVLSIVILAIMLVETGLPTSFDGRLLLAGSVAALAWSAVIGFGKVRFLRADDRAHAAGNLI